MAGDDTGFAFDLFSDIAPLLALFGDQFARQFTSESLTWIDHLIFSMVPLGILTVITGAIRVQGPRIAKSFIGRGRENRALAEIELMSSTSREVCELFNGKSIIRVMGRPKLAQMLVYPLEYERLEAVYREHDGKQWDARVLETSLVDNTCGIHSLPSAATTNDTNGVLFLECIDYQSDSYATLLRFWSSFNSTFRVKVNNRQLVPKNKFTWLGPPNLQLGLSSNQFELRHLKKRHELFLAAVAAVILQMGLLAIATVTVYHSRTRQLIGVEPKVYGFPCYIIGSILLSVGIALCSLAVERNTTEHAWKIPRRKKHDDKIRSGGHQRAESMREKLERSPRLLWLQQNQEVNDQSFDGYAILAGPKRHIITSSRMEDIPESKKRPDSGSETDLKSESSHDGEDTRDHEDDPIWESITVFAVLAAGLGFVAQFMGLRGLAYPCSVAQLTAIFLMALVRAIIRRRLGRIPMHCSAFNRYEVDYLATQIVYYPTFRKYYEDEGVNKRMWFLRQQKPDEIFQWQVKTAKADGSGPFYFHSSKEIMGGLSPGVEPKYRTWQERELSRSRTLGASYGLEAKVTDYLTIEAASSQQLLRVRERLSDLCEWPSAAFDGAQALARSIETFMDTFFPEKSTDQSTRVLGKRMDTLTWFVETSQPLLPYGRIERSDCIYIPIRRLQNGQWQVDLAKIEAVLSLWMAAVEARTNAQANAKMSDSKNAAANTKDWRRAKAGTDLRRSYCRILGDKFDDGILKRDLAWWVDELIADQSDSQISPIMPPSDIEKNNAEKGGSETTNGSINSAQDQTPFAKPRWICSKERAKAVDLVIGFNGRSEKIDERRRLSKHSAKELAITSSGLLPSILAQHMFTNFMWTVVDQLPEDCLRQGFMSSEQDVEIENRHTFDPQEFIDTWHRPILRHRLLTKLVRKLEESGLGTYTEIMLCIVPALSFRDLLPNHVILKLIPQMRQGQGWTATARSYSRLLETSMRTNPDESFCYSAVVATMDFLYFACEPYDKYIEPPIELATEIEDLVARLASSWFAHIIKKLMPLYGIQRRRQQFEEIFERFGIHAAIARLEGDERLESIFKPQEFLEGWAEAFKTIGSEFDFEFCEKKLGFSKPYKHIYLASIDGAAEISLQDYQERSKRPLADGARHAKLGDIFGWTPLHYTAIVTDDRLLRSTFDTAVTKKLQNIHQILDRFNRSPVHVAASVGERYRLHWLFGFCSREDKKNALNTPGLDGMTPLHLAVKSGNMDCVGYVLNQCSVQTVQHPDFWGRTPIHLAASYGLDKISDLLLTKGAQPYTADESGRTPLGYLLKGDVDLTKDQLDDPADICLASIGALWKLDSDMKDTLEDDSSDDESTTSSSKDFDQTADQDDALVRKKNIFLSFAKKKLDYRDDMGMTFLHHAVMNADVGTVRSLVETGYKLDDCDLQGRSSLHLAVLKGRLAMTKELLQRFDHFVPDLSLTDKSQETAFMKAAYGGYIDIVKLLMAHDRSHGQGSHLDLSAKNWGGRTALHLAIASQKYSVALHLLFKGPKHNDLKDNNGESLLVTACKAYTREGSSKCVQAILDRWPELINVPDEDYDETPLAWACEEGCEEVANVLLAHNDIDPNIKAPKWRGYVPLHFAISSGNINLIEPLLDHTATLIDVTNDQNETPIDLALWKEDIPAVRMLLLHHKATADIRARYLAQLCVDAAADKHELMQDVLANIPVQDITAKGLLGLIRKSEEFCSINVWELFAKRAFESETWKHMETPLHAAVRLGDLGLLVSLKRSGSLTALLDSDGWSCIDYARTYRTSSLSKEVMQFLQTELTELDRTSKAIVPGALKDSDPNDMFTVAACSELNHKDCKGVHTLEVTGVDEGYRTTIRALNPAPPHVGIKRGFYFEVKIKKESESKLFGLGFCDRQYDEMQMPGWHNTSFGYHGDDGGLFINDGAEPQAPSKDFGPGGVYGLDDTVGAGINMETGTGFFTVNGKRKDMGNIFADSKFNGRKMYPCVGFDSSKEGAGLCFEINLGLCLEKHPFKYRGAHE